MNDRIHQLRQCLRDFDFSILLIEVLGWNSYAAQPFVLTVGGTDYVLKPLAEKCGMVVYACEPGADGAPPPYPLRRKIEQQVRKTAHEHLIIFTDARQTVQIWQWVKHQAGKGAACREHTYREGQTGQALVEKLQGLAFELEEEERLTIFDVTARARSALDVDRVTKRFYDRFKKEHQAFLKFIQGIGERTDRDWYASLMLNRMMFIYFIQKRGFLDNDSDYLRNRLRMVQEHRGKGKFLSFYRFFLLRLFHEGLGKPASDRARDLDALLGGVPYLNGGLFDVHELERQYNGIDIPDEAFVAIFDFFDSYTWHLDERPLCADNEINPDVLGYIFEKYINQKQMGAYYTKEDITGYISRNTVIPYLFDAAQKECPIAFRSEGGVWRLLRDDPDRYIYQAVRSGVVRSSPDSPSSSFILPPSSLPDFVREGMADPKKRMFNKQYNLGRANIPGPDGENLALPTETWREYVERRTRCLELRANLVEGEIHTINDFITFNLDIEQFAEDVIVNSEGPELVWAFWKALTGISILDPTCGSGAFLFAALNILEPLYNACLDGMQGFIEDLEHSEQKHSPKKLSNFQQVLTEMEKHPNRRYFVLKSIVISNLYGVDIMDEAVEICKLRLFLKLVAQVETVKQIEPLPDIDFNVRAGNTLVGFTSLDAVRDAMTYEPGGQHRMLYPEEEETLNHIKEEAELTDRAFQFFHKMQTKHDMDAAEFAGAKMDVRSRLDSLRNELDRYLARDYGTKVEKRGELDKWRVSHKPFHWFVEFYGIMKKGGFFVIIGNPPYIEYSAVRSEYTIRDYQTQRCGNLYAFVIERCYNILKNNGRVGMIVQLPLVCTDRMKPVQKECLSRTHSIWFSNFDDRPSRLFDGLEHIRATVFLSQKGMRTKPCVYSTAYVRWYSEFREHLLQSIFYSNVGAYLMEGAIPKIGSQVAKRIKQVLRNFIELKKDLSPYDARHPAYFHNAPQYWIRALDFAPYFWNERGGEQISTQIKSILFSSKKEAGAFVAALNSSLFYWWFIVLSDCRHLNMREIETFPVSYAQMTEDIKGKLAELAERLMIDFDINKQRKECQYAKTGRVIYDEYYPKHSKAIIDQIDCVLGKYYGFTDEELDYIINYDIKYRTGQLTSDDDDVKG